MNKDFQDIFNKAKQVNISSVKKQQIRSNLELFIKNHPVINTGVNRHIFQDKSKENIPTFLELSTLKLFFNNKLKPMLATLLIALILGGGTSFAAERALPGDLLYPAKVSINEEVRGWLAVGDESEADWNAKLVVRRLEEAEKLISKGKLDPEVEAELQTRFESHIAAFRENTKDLEDKKSPKSLEMYSDLEVTLKAHEKFLARMEGEEVSTILAAKASVSSVVTDEEISLLSKVRNNLDATVKSRVNNEVKVSAETNVEFKKAAEGKLKSTEHKIDEVQDFIANSKAEAQVKAEAEAKLKTAGEVVVRGNAEIENRAYGKAFASFQEAMRIAQEAKLSVRGQKLIKADMAFPNEDMDVGVGTFLEGSEDSNKSDTEDIELETEIKAEIKAGNATTGSKSSGKINIELGL